MLLYILDKYMDSEALKALHKYQEKLRTPSSIGLSTYYKELKAKKAQ